MQCLHCTGCMTWSSITNTLVIGIRIIQYTLTLILLKRTLNIKRDVDVEGVTISVTVYAFMFV